MLTLSDYMAMLGFTRRTERGVRDALAQDHPALTEACVELLAALAAEPGATVSSVAARTSVSQQAVSKLAAVLIALQYVAAETSSSDRRRRPLYVTPKGEKVLTVVRTARLRACEALDPADPLGAMAVAL